MGISKRLRDLRIKKNYTLSTVEKKTGIRKGTLSRYENGKAKPSFDNLIRLADFYRVSLDKLCSRDVKLTLENNEPYVKYVSNDFIKIVNALYLPQNERLINYIIKDPERRIKAISDSYFRIHNV